MALSDTALVTLTQAKNYLRADAAASLHIDAEYVGMGNGTTKAFTLDHTPLEGSLKLYVNGVLKVENTDFTISGATVTFTTAPTLNYPITSSYDYAAGDDTFESFDDELLEHLINAATLKAEDHTERAFIQRSITERHHGDGQDILMLYRRPVVSITSVSYERVVGKTGDGSTTAFALGYIPKTDSLTVYVDGVLKKVEDDYALDDQTVTFTSAPAEDAKIIFRFNVELDLVDDYEEWLNIGRLKGSWEKNYIYVVVYIAGYGVTRSEAQADIPDAVAAVLMTVANWYENRLGVKSENVTGIGSADYGPAGILSDGAKQLLSSIKV